MKICKVKRFGETARNINDPMNTFRALRGLTARASSKSKYRDHGPDWLNTSTSN